MSAQPDDRTLILQQVTIGLGGRRLLELSAVVRPGEVLTVMGASGSGKSTLLSYISGTLEPAFAASGSVRSGAIEMTSLPAHLRKAGLLFQDPLLFAHLSVGENVQFAIPEEIGNRKVRRQIAERALDSVELGGFYDRNPETLSGGQKARVALVRVLVSQPRMLLLDEPFAKLDMALRAQVRDLVFAEAREAGLPVILVTHDQADATAAGGAVIELGGDA